MASAKLPGQGGPSHATFQFEDDHWVVAYGEKVIRLRDAKGLRCLAILLRAPGRRSAARELLEGAASPGASSRFDALRPPGPPQPAAGAEHARVLVTKLIKGAIQRIATYHPELGTHLRRTISTGHHCAYTPDPEYPIIWRL